jgi:phospholipid/cholesterol/gamma-HCH transport system substrate-binding protein
MTRRPGRVRRALDRVKREPGLKKNVAALVLLVLLAGVSGVIILGNERVGFPWERAKFVFYATFDRTPGVSPGHGQEVRIAGVPVGEIDNAGVDSAGKAVLKLSIDSKYPVYDNANLVMRPKSPLNEMYVEISPGGPPGHRLSSGATLPVTHSQSPVEIDQALDHLDGNAREALSTLLAESDTALANAPSTLPGGLSASDVLVKRLTPVLTAINTRRANLQRLVTSLAEIASAVGGDDSTLSHLASSLQTTLDAMGSGSSALNSSLALLPNLLSQLKSATDAVSTLSAQLNPTLSNLKTASGSLPTALRKVTDTLDQVKETVAHAAPVIKIGVPVVQDLRPLVGDVAAALPDLTDLTVRADPVTAMLVKYLPDAGAFVLNTRSMTSLTDASGGILRGMLVIQPSAVPSTLLPTLQSH